MSVPGPQLQLLVADKAGVVRGTIGGYSELRAVARWGAAETLEVTLPTSHPRLADVVAPGARLILRHRPDVSAAWSLVTSGTVSPQRSGGRGRSLVTASVVSDWARLMTGLLGWPNPAGAVASGWLSGQGDDGAQWTMTGPAERVALALIAANVAHGATPVTVVVPPVGRGDTITVSVRMKPLADVLFPLVTQAGVGIRVAPAPAGPGLVVTGHVGSLVPQVLTEESGVVVDGEFSLTPPTVTRVIVGGQGEGTERVFRRVVDTALESEWGLCLEGFVDARDLQSDTVPPTADAALAAALDARGRETLAEGAPQASASCELTESPAFRYGVRYRLGDRVRVQLDGAPVVEETVTEVAFSDTVNDGLVITPTVGVRTDPLRAVVNIASTALRGVRDLQAGR